MQHLTSVLLPRMLHETSICGRRVGVGNWTTLRAAKVGSWAVVSAVAVFWNSPLLAVAGLAGQLVPQGSPRCAGSGTALVTESWLPVSGVCGRSWVLRFTVDTDSSVSARGPGCSAGPVPPATFMLDVCFEPEAVGDRTLKSVPLVVHGAMRGAVVGTEGVDVEVKGSGSLDVHEEEGGVGSLQHRARFLL